MDPHKIPHFPLFETMDIILTDIVFSLARAAVATLLAKELYSVTIPTLFLFSIIIYSVLTRDPIRASLPPYIGFKGVWDVLWGKKRVRNGKGEVVRLSIFRRDVFWISKGDVMNELVASGRINPVFYGNGIVIPYDDKEKAAVEKVFTSANLAMFHDVMDEEEGFFIEKVSKAQIIAVSVIQEFVSRTLQRMVYGMGPKDKIVRHRSPYRRSIRRLLFYYYFPYLYGLLRPEKAEKEKQSRNVLSFEYQLRKQSLEHPTFLAQYIVEQCSAVITGGLHQALVGLLSNFQIGRQAQNELDKILHTDRITMDDVQDLVVLPAIVAESLRLSIMASPTNVLYQITQDLWYKKYFLPKNSIIVFDRDEIFTDSIKLSDGQFRPERFFENNPSIEDIDAVAFADGLPQKTLVKIILLNTVATVLRKFNIVRSKSDGKLKYVRFNVRPVKDS